MELIKRIGQFYSSLSRTDLSIYSLLFFLFIALRLHASSQLGIWVDESMDIFTALDYSSWDLLSGNYYDLAHPPLAFLFLKFFTQFSLDLFSLRAVSVLFSFVGFITLPLSLSFWIKSEHKHSLIFIFLAALIFSNQILSLNIIVQTYSLAFMFMMFELLFFSSLYFEKYIFSQKKDFYTLILLCFLSFYSDYSAIWLHWGLFSFALASYLLKLRPSNKVLKALSLGFLSLLLWIYPFVKRFKGALSYESYIDKVSGYQGDSPFLDPLIYWADQFFELYESHFLIKYSQMDLPGYAMVLTVLFLITLVRFSRKEQKLALLLLCLTIEPVAVAHLFSIAVSGMMHPRNMFIVTMALLLIQSLVYFRFYLLYPRKWLVVLLVLPSLLHFSKEYPSLPYRPDSIIGGQEVVNQALAYGKKQDWVFISESRFYQLVNFRYYALLQSKNLSLPMRIGELDLKNLKDKEIFFTNTKPLNNSAVFDTLAQQLGCERINLPSSKHIAYFQYCKL